MSGKAEFKPKEEIDELLQGIRRIFVIECGWCSAVTGATGAPSRKLLKAYLKEKGIRVDSCVATAVCLNNILHQRLRQFRRKIRKADAIGIASCAVGVEAAYWLTDNTKRIIPFYDTIGTGGRFTDWPDLGGIITCIPNKVCNLTVTNGVCTEGNCPLKLRLPCIPVDELVRECKEDKTKDCPFFQVKEEGNLDKLIEFEEKLKKEDKPRVPLFENANPPMAVGKYRLEGRLLGDMFAKLSRIFCWSMNQYGY